MIINVPPQEGKSEQVIHRFPAYALGRDPNLRVVGCCYSATLALLFSHDVQLIMDEPNYARLFPESIIPGFATKHNAAVRQADHFELVGIGWLPLCGVQGSIAGLPPDVLIVDDPYKDHLEVVGGARGGVEQLCLALAACAGRSRRPDLLDPLASSDELNAGNWYLPHPQLAPWVEAFLFELSAFPRGKHDDWLHAWTQAREVLSGAGIVDNSMFTSALRVAPFPIIPPGLQPWWDL